MFSLGGLRSIASYTTAPAIAHDKINRALDEKFQKAQEDQPDTATELRTSWGRFWLRKRRPAA